MTLLSALVLLAHAALAGAARASTLTVTTTSDEVTSQDGQCSLREAVAAVNSPGTATDCGTASSTSNTILLSTGTYTLSIAPTGTDDNSSGDLNVTGTTPLTIRGAGKAKTVINATGLGDRVLSIAAGATVKLRNLEISGGQAPGGAGGAPCNPYYIPAIGGPGGSGANGGGIYNSGKLSLRNIEVTANTAGPGGPGGPCFSLKYGLYGYGGRGGSGGDGGGIYNLGALSMTYSTIVTNNAGPRGRGGLGHDGRLGPSGPRGLGGGIFNDGTATLKSSTVSGNSPDNCKPTTLCS